MPHTDHPALLHVHETKEEVASVELTPAHPPREETPIYKKTHHQLVVEEDSPCAICGVRRSTLADPAQNPFGATQLETHHFPIERSLLNACDWRKIAAKFKQVTSEADLEEFVDGPANMLVLCDQCHRSPQHGIHHLLPQDWFIQPFLKQNYEIAATASDAAQAMAADERIEEQTRAVGDAPDAQQ